jgi:ubiquinone/menaquinone biosynthesis C-methylase UbiE
MPGVDVRFGVAEALPWADDIFDCAAAQLVVHLMADPVAGLSEMARVTRPGGTVAATVWDFSGGTAPASAFWRAALASLGGGRRAAVRDACARLLPSGPFTMSVRSWTARGRA